MEVHVYSTITTATPSIFKHQQSGMILPIRGEVLRDEPKIIYDLYIDSFSIWNILMTARQYLYQACAEFGWWQTSDSKKQPFGNLFPYRFIVKELCTDIFGSNFTELRNILGTLYTNVLNYGLAGANKSSRIAFSHGSIDPWQALGVTSNRSISANNTAYYIQGITKDVY